MNKAIPNIKKISDMRMPCKKNKSELLNLSQEELVEIILNEKEIVSEFQKNILAKTSMMLAAISNLTYK